MISDNGKAALNECTQVNNKYSESYRASISNRLFATSSTCPCSLLLARPTQLVRGLPCYLYLGLLSLDLDLDLSAVTLTLSQSDLLHSLAITFSQRHSIGSRGIIALCQDYGVVYRSRRGCMEPSHQQAPVL